MGIENTIEEAEKLRKEKYQKLRVPFSIERILAPITNCKTSQTHGFVKMIRLGVLGSTNGTDLQVILDAIESKRLISKVSVVVSNKKNAFILERAKKHKIPYYYISHKHIDRETFDGRITNMLKKHMLT